MSENHRKPNGSLFLSLTDWWFPTGGLVAQGSAPLVLEEVLEAAADYLRLEPQLWCCQLLQKVWS